MGKHKSICSNCGNRKTNQEVLHESTEDKHDPENGWWEQTVWQIIKCGGCDTISFRQLYQDVRYEDTEWSETLYPIRNAFDVSIKNLEKTPKNIELIYKETINAFNNDLLILCAGGIRAIIEGICKDKSIIGGNIPDTKKDGSPKFELDGITPKIKNVTNLEGKIEGLHEKGFLTSSNAKILHELRFMGNHALHELSHPAKEQLIIAIKIVEHILDTIYEIQHKASKLTSRDKKK